MQVEGQWRLVYQPMSACKEQTGCTCDRVWNYCVQVDVNDARQEEQKKAQRQAVGEEKVSQTKMNENSILELTVEDRHKNNVDAGGIWKQRRKESIQAVAQQSQPPGPLTESNCRQAVSCGDPRVHHVHGWNNSYPSRSLIHRQLTDARWAAMASGQMDEVLDDRRPVSDG